MLLQSLSFTEFVAIMVVTGAVEEMDGQPLSAENVYQSFAGYAHITAHDTDGVNLIKPLWEYDNRTPSCRMRWAKKVDSTQMQIVMLFLVAVDVIAVLLELML